MPTMINIRPITIVLLYHIIYYLILPTYMLQQLSNNVIIFRSLQIIAINIHTVFKYEK